jgi:hypothetical protein
MHCYGVDLKKLHKCQENILKTEIRRKKFSADSVVVSRPRQRLQSAEKAKTKREVCLDLKDSDCEFDHLVKRKLERLEGDRRRRSLRRKDKSGRK